MNKRFFYLLGIAITIVLGMILYHHFCCKHKTNCKLNNITIAPPTVTEKSDSVCLETRKFEISTYGFNYTCEDNFNFKENTFNFITPLSPLLDSGIIQLKAFMNQSPNHRLKITGYCTLAEKNTSAYPSLGFARANNVKNYLVAQGMNAKQFETEGQVVKAWKINTDTVKGPIAYRLAERQIEPAPNLDGLKDTLNMNPPVLYFGSMESSVNLTDKERQQIQIMTQYLDQVPRAQIDISGYSDSMGSLALNMQLSLARANFAKQYLVKNGIAANRITCIAKGPKDFIASNATEEGKRKNRRVVINLK